MYIFHKCKKLINGNKPFKATFRGCANRVTLGTIDKLHKLGCTITKERNHLIVEKK